MKALTISDADMMVLGLQDEIRRSEESRYDHRLHGVLLVAQGMTCPEVARLLGDAPRTVERWVHHFEQDGLAGLTEGERGRPAPAVGRSPTGASATGATRPSRGGGAGRESLGRPDLIRLPRSAVWDSIGGAPVPAPLPTVRLSAPQTARAGGESGPGVTGGP